MKYALLIYGLPEFRDLPEAQLKSVVGEFEAILGTPGVLDGMQLQGTESAMPRSISEACTCSRRTTSTRRRPLPHVFRRPAWAAPLRCVQSWSDRRAARRRLPQ
jgi:hypothetical protein